MTPDDARALFLEARVAHLATADATGAPHIVPITFAVASDRIFTGIDDKPKRGPRLHRLKNIAANPRVSVLVDNYDEEWRRLWWVRADGAARIVAPGPELDAAFDALRDRYQQYRAVDLIGPAIVVDVDRWTGWSAEALG